MSSQLSASPLKVTVGVTAMRRLVRKGEAHSVALATDHVVLTLNPTCATKEVWDLN